MRVTSILKWSSGLYTSGCAATMAPYTLRSSARALSTLAPGARREDFRHTMLAPRHHCGGEMMRAGDDIGDDLRCHRIGNGWFQNTNHGRGAGATAALQRTVFPITLGSECSDV